MGFLICITNLLILLILGGYLATMGPEWYVNNNTPESTSFLLSNSIFNSAPEFCFTFHFQIYFLIVLQYLGHRQKMLNGYKVAAATNLTVLGFCFLYSVLCLSTNIVFTNFKDAIYDSKILIPNKILLNVLLLFVTSLQIPFKFFLEKEFLFILYDELKNKSVSTKILDERK